ncbi:MAG: polymer-forming cytoskeletal protein, partial [Candidatus Delongbacteria bacterium]
MTKFTDFTLPAADTLKADVKVYNGNALIDGYLEGNLDVYSGNINIGEAGKVTGYVKAYAGKVFVKGKIDDDKSYFVVDEIKSLILGKDKDFPQNREITVGMGVSGPDNALTSGNDDQKGFFFHNSLIRKDFISYSKVEGLYLGINADIKLLDTKYIDFNANASGGYAFRMEKWQYYFDQKLSFFDEKLILGGAQYRSVASEDQRKLPSSLNSASAFFLHQDFYNYYMAEGYGLFAGSLYNIEQGDNSHEFGIKAGVYSEDIDSLRNRTQWALFFNGRDFIPNKAVDAGKLVELTSTARYVGKLKSINTFVDTYYTHEQTLDQYDQEFSFTKGLFSIFVESRVKDMFVFSNLFRLESVSPYDLSADRTTPNFKYISMGGTGTLPGYKLNEFKGNRGFYDRLILGFTGLDMSEFR